MFFFKPIVAILAQAMAHKMIKRPASNGPQNAPMKRPAAPRHSVHNILDSASSVQHEPNIHMGQDGVERAIRMHSPQHGAYEGRAWMAEIGPARSSLRWKMALGGAT